MCFAMHALELTFQLFWSIQFELEIVRHKTFAPLAKVMFSSVIVLIKWLNFGLIQIVLQIFLQHCKTSAKLIDKDSAWSFSFLQRTILSSYHFVVLILPIYFCPTCLWNIWTLDRYGFSYISPAPLICLAKLNIYSPLFPIMEIYTSSSFSEENWSKRARHSTWVNSQFYANKQIDGVLNV